MMFVGSSTGQRGSTFFEFLHEGHRYLVIRSPDGRRLWFKTHFSRWTENVFGNGSRDVYQSGYRELPYGRAYRRLRDAFEDLVQSQGKAA